MTQPTAFTVTSKVSAPACLSIGLFLNDSDQAVWIEELLWTLECVQSVTHLYDGETKFLGLKVIGHPAQLEADVNELITAHQLGKTLTIQKIEVIEEADWAECWKQYWHVQKLLPSLVIQPSWEAYTPHPNDIVLKLDPGSAFGTGTHHTTQTMLQLLYEFIAIQQRPIQSMLDAGTGSGILAIYAARLGVSRIVAMDNDPHAVLVAQENVVLNGVEAQVGCTTEPIEALCAEKPFDLVVANILATILMDLMPVLKNAISPQGLLLLGGISVSQYFDVLECVNRNGLKVQRVLIKGDWVTFVCNLPA